MTLSFIILTIILIVAAIFDIAKRRIPNVLTGGAIALGLFLHARTASIIGIEEGLIGLAIAFCIGFPLWKNKAIGGGDHKLLMAIGAFLGYPLILTALCATAIAGGIEGAIWLIAKKSKEESWAHLLKTQTIPYGLAIAVGTIFTLYFL